MRLTLDMGPELPEAYRMMNFCIYIAPQPQQLVILNGNQTLHQVNDKFWKVNFKVNFFLNIKLKNTINMTLFRRLTSPWKCIIHGKNRRVQ